MFILQSEVYSICREWKDLLRMEIEKILVYIKAEVYNIRREMKVLLI